MKTYSRLTLAFLLLLLIVPQVRADDQPKDGEHVEHHGKGKKKSDGNLRDGLNVNEPFVFDWSEDAEEKNRSSAETRTQLLRGKLPEGSIHFDVLLPDGTTLSRRCPVNTHKDSSARIQHDFAKEQSKRAALDCKWELIISPTQSVPADEGKPNELQTKIIVEQHLSIRSYADGIKKIPAKESAIVAEDKRLRDDYFAAKQNIDTLLKKLNPPGIRIELTPEGQKRNNRRIQPLVRTLKRINESIQNINVAVGIVTQLTNSVIEYQVYVQPPDGHEQIVLMQSSGFANEASSKADLEKPEKRAAETEATD